MRLNLYISIAQEKTRLLVSDSLGIPFGAAAILYVGSYLMTYFDWRYIFWFAGVGCGISAVAWHFVARDTPEGKQLHVLRI